jgi:methylthioribose-1-phosphate isomerase
MRWAPQGVTVRNPAFDVTPADLITAIICEKTVVSAPSRERLQPLISTSA